MRHSLSTIQNKMRLYNFAAYSASYFIINEQPPDLNSRELHVITYLHFLDSLYCYIIYMENSAILGVFRVLIYAIKIAQKIVTVL